MPAIEFVGQSRHDSDNKVANTSRLINCYREPTESGNILKTVLGTELISATTQVIATSSTIVNEQWYVSIGQRIIGVSQAGTVTELGNISFDPNTNMSSNNQYLTICYNGVYQVYDTVLASFPGVQFGAFSDIGSVAFLGQRTFLSERNGRRFQWSNVITPQTINGLAFATAESKDDNIVRLVAINGLLWIFGTRSIERWYLTNQSSVVAPVAGGTTEVGLKTFNSFVAFPNGGFFIGSDNKAYIVEGQNIQPISSTGVETAISQGILSYCWHYQDEGHEIIVVGFEDRPAFCYDFSTAEWHERANNKLDPITINTCAFVYGGFYAADQLGRIVKLTRNSLDVDQPLISTAISRTLNNTGTPFRVAKLEIQTITGTGLVSQPSVPVSINLRTSKDRGQNWSPEMTRQLGIQGEYTKRVIWRSLGRFESTLTAELSWSDPIETPVEATVWVDLV